MTLARTLFRFKTVAAFTCFFGLWTGCFAQADESRLEVFDTRLKPLIAKHCLRCHGPQEQEGDLRLDQLDPDLVEGKDADHWHEVLNQLNEGEMPPEDQPQLTPAELARVTTWLENELQKAAERRNSTGGRQLMRRMNRYEYQYTLEDLLGISLDYSENIPIDLSGGDGLKTNATLLGTSVVQMQAYLDVAEQALQEAIPDRPAERVFKETINKLAVTTIRGQRKKGPRNKKGKNAQGNQVNPSIIAPSPGFRQSNFTYDLPRKVTFNDRPFAGRFALRILVKATAASDGRLPELTAQVGHRASGDYEPKKVVGRQIIRPTDEPQLIDFVGNIEDFPLGNKDGYYNGSGSHNVTHLSVWLWNTVLPQSDIDEKTKLEDVDEPLLEVLSVEFEGPLLDGFPSQTARDLLPPSPNQANEKEYARETLSRFLTRAFRRKVSDAEIGRTVESFQAFRKLSPDFKSAMRKTIAMVLVSPKFLYLMEPSGDEKTARQLDAFELATRLSYFLWASMPDKELLELASTGQLMRPEVLRAQVSRMRQDAKFQRFVRHFNSQWLNLPALDHVAINPSAHPAFSDDIRENLKLETLAFAAHVFTNDLNCRNFIHSDFAVLNQVVARHYGIDGVYGSHFRPVRLQEDDHRGGVLTQGSICIIGSDGTDSNPIYRGVWLRKRLFADPPPPPPPGAPPLDKSNPKLSTLTLKEQIKLHRASASCARCHDKIDPWGIAFENYDATGRWRAGQHKDIVFDATSTLPDGTTVQGMRALKQYLIKNRSDALANALARRMSSYALGRQLEFSDDEMVTELVRRFEKNGYRISSLIDGIVMSQAFRTK